MYFLFCICSLFSVVENYYRILHFISMKSFLIGCSCYCSSLSRSICSLVLVSYVFYPFNYIPAEFILTQHLMKKDFKHLCRGHKGSFVHFCFGFFKRIILSKNVSSVGLMQCPLKSVTPSIDSSRLSHYSRKILRAGFSRVGCLTLRHFWKSYPQLISFLDLHKVTYQTGIEYYLEFNEWDSVLLL